MTINYYLDKPQEGVKQNQQKVTAIYLFIRSGQSKIKLNIGRRILPKCWDANKQQAKNMTGSPELNGYLTNLKAEIQNLINFLSSKGKVTIAQVKEAATTLIGGRQLTEEKKQPGFNELFEEFLKVQAAKWDAATIRKFRTLQNHLNIYATQSKSKLQPEKMDKLFFQKLTSFLLTYRKPSSKEGEEPALPMTNNTVQKLTVMLRTFLIWALDAGFTTNADFRKFKFNELEQETDEVSLTESELMNLYQADLSLLPALDRVRDVFCFSTFTGQRFSDVAGLLPDHIKGETWHLRVKKTKSINKVPLNSFALSILKKYDGQPLPVISNQRTNEHLKVLCRKVGIDEPTTLHRYNGAEVITRTGPKHEFIGTHTARRTFATVMLEKGLRPEVVMRIGGWKDYKSFRKYIRLTDQTAAEELKAITWEKS